MEAQRVLGDGERDAGAGELDGVHVAVDPHRRSRAIRLGADRQQPEVAALERWPMSAAGQIAGNASAQAWSCARELVVAEVGARKPRSREDRLGTYEA